MQRQFADRTQLGVVTEKVSGAFFPLTIATAIVVLVSVWFLASPVFAIKASYGLLGLLAAGGIYHLHGSTGVNWSVRGDARSSLGSVVLALASGAIIVTQLTGSRLFVILFVLPVCYLLLGIQLRHRISPGWGLVQILALFLLGTASKYLTTGMYFGAGDTITHVGYVDRVVSSGTWYALPNATMYQHFPGFHSFLGSLAVLGDFAPYDAYMLVGIAMYCIGIVGVYLLARHLLNPTTALCIALAMSLLRPSLVYANYFFPQAFFTILSIVLLYILYRATDPDSDTAAFVLASVAFVPALVLSHHLSVVLIAPAFVLVVLVPLVARRTIPTPFFDAIAPKGLPLAALVLGAFAYWSLGDVFLPVLVSALQDVLSKATLIGSSSGTRELIALGLTVPPLEEMTAVRSLASSSGIYNIALVSALALGCVTLLDDLDMFSRAIGVIVTGLLMTVFVLRIPVDILGIQRLGLTMSVFVAFVLGTGLSKLLYTAEFSAARALPGLLIFALLASSAHGAVAHDLYGLHAGPDLWEKQPLPEDQQAFTGAEYRQLEVATETTTRYDTYLTTDWVSRSVIDRYRGEAPGRMTFGEDSISIDQGGLLYRDRWSERSQELIPELRVFQTLVLGDGWLDRMVRTENKVYTTGEVGILRDREDGRYLRSSQDI